LLIVALAWPGLALAGAWTSPKGGIYAKLTYGASSANEQFGFDGLLKPVVDGLTDYPFADRSIYLFAEYGVTDELTVSALVPFKRLFMHDMLFRYSTTGIADVAVGARYLAYNRDGWVGSVSGSASLPTGYHRDFQPPLGAGQVDAIVALNVGRSFWPLPSYATASVGLRLRSGIYISAVQPSSANNPFFKDRVDYADALVYTAEAGWTFFDRVLVHAVVNGAASLRASGNAFSITSVPSTERFLKVGGGIGVGPIPHVELSADAYTTVSGMNTVKSIDIFLGAGVKF
jgi:hypothetical protein